MNERQCSDIIRYLLGCTDVKGPSLTWVILVDDMLADLHKKAVAGIPVYYPELLQEYLPVELANTMLDAVFTTKYMAHISYALSYRDSIVGNAIFIIFAVAANQQVLIHEDGTTYADILMYRHRASLSPEKVDAATDLWRAFLAKYLKPQEPVATELGDED